MATMVTCDLASVLTTLMTSLAVNESSPDVGSSDNKGHEGYRGDALRVGARSAGWESEEQIGALTPSLDAGCTNLTADMSQGRPDASVVN